MRILLLLILILHSPFLQSQSFDVAIPNDSLADMSPEEKGKFFNKETKKYLTTNPKLSIKLIDSAFYYASLAGDSLNIAHSYRNRGTTYYYQGNYALALKNYLQSLRINQNNYFNNQIWRDYNNIALVYTEMEAFEDALYYYNLALTNELSRDDTLGIALLHNNIGIVYRNLRDYEKALDNYEKSLNYNKMLNNEPQLAFNYNNIGNICFDQEDFRIALEYYNQALELNMKLGNHYEIAKNKINIASTYLKMGNYQKTIPFLTEAKRIIENFHLYSLELYLTETYIEYYENLPKQSEKLKLAKLYKVKDSLNQEIASKELQQMKRSFEINQKEYELELLKTKNRLNDQQIARYKLLRTGFIIILVLLVIIFVLSYYLYVTHKRSKENLEKLIDQRTAELEEATKKAEESNRLKTSFLSNMTHEVRTPLNAIVGYSNLVELENCNHSEHKQYAGNIKKSSMHLLNLIDDITYVARMENNDIQLNYSKCNVNKILNKIYNKFSRVYLNGRSKKIDFSINVPIKDGINELRTDCRMLTEILDKIVENAFKFTKSGYIKLGYDIIKDFIVFYIEDTGVGISEEFQTHVFNKFFKLTVNNEEHNDGAGLGLTIAKGNVDLLNGKIVLHSTPKSGSRFEIYLRLQK